MPNNFKNDYRMEAVYFQKLKSDIDIAKSYITRGAVDEAKALLENAVDVDGAVLLLYRNIGELWSELADQIEQTRKALDALEKKMNDYHDELNEKIDEINNYIIRLINALEARVEALERESKVKFAFLTYDSTEQEYAIEMDGSPVDFDTLYALCEFPHNVVVTDENGTVYFIRKYGDSVIEWTTDGVDSNGDYKEIIVTINSSDSVNVQTKDCKYVAGNGISIIDHVISTYTEAEQITPTDYSEDMTDLTAGDTHTLSYNQYGGMIEIVNKTSKSYDVKPFLNVYLPAFVMANLETATLNSIKAQMVSDHVKGVKVEIISRIVIETTPSRIIEAKNTYEVYNVDRNTGVPTQTLIQTNIPARIDTPFFANNYKGSKYHLYRRATIGIIPDSGFTSVAMATYKSLFLDSFDEYKYVRYQTGLSFD